MNILSGSFWKKTIVGGVFLLILSVVLGMIMGSLMGYDPITLPGVRSINDPLMMLFYLYPFVLAGATSIAFGMVKSMLKGNAQERAMSFAWLLILVVTVPSMFLLITSMNYPTAFFITNALRDVIGFVGLGTLFVKMDG